RRSLVGQLGLPRCLRRRDGFDGPRVAMTKRGDMAIPAHDRAEHEARAATVAGRHAAHPVFGAEPDLGPARAALQPSLGHGPSLSDDQRRRLRTMPRTASAIAIDPVRPRPPSQQPPLSGVENASRSHFATGAPLATVIGIVTTSERAALLLSVIVT